MLFDGNLFFQIVLLFSLEEQIRVSLCLPRMSSLVAVVWD